jgi:uncharacterized protein YabE (DUF348 family)
VRIQALASGALAALIVAGGAGAVSALHKDVTVTVDGDAKRVPAFALTVSDVLSEQGIELKARDIVTPSLDTPVSDGDTIEVQYHKELTIRLDGKTQAIGTYEETLDEALDAAELDGLEGAEFSVPETTELPREGLAVTIVTPKTVTLTVAGEKQTVTTTAETVDGLLADKGVAFDGDDRVTPDPGTTVTEGAEITLDKVEVTTETRKESVKFKTETQESSKLWKGESQITTAGVKGKATVTYEVTLVNGEVESEKVITKKVTKEPVTQVVLKGTKTTPNGVGINLAHEAQWNKIAKCESGGNWHINTGNGYYGGLQFSKSSWISNGGRDFAALPHQATREQQITVANRYYAKAGFKPWACKP